MHEPAPGELIAGKYRLVRRLGAGGMGKVFLARVEGVAGFEKQVAIKLAHDHVAHDGAVMDLFLAEARLSANLTHANIAQIYDLGEDDDTYFIAMEYVAGRDLRALMRAAEARGEKLPIPVCCYVVSKLCEGLDYAHRQKDRTGRPLKLVHRDISPVNCLISFTGEVKLIDFGIAKAATEASKTRTGFIRGKIGYMSPEQVRGQPLDRRSDIFSVGALLYELLCGPRPFDAENELETMRNVRDCRFTRPREVDPEIPEELERILLKALAAEREARYQWASELEVDIQRYLFSTGAPVSGRDLGEYLVDLLGGSRIVAAELLGPDAPPQTASTRMVGASGPRGSERTSDRVTRDSPSRVSNVDDVSFISAPAATLDESTDEARRRLGDVTYPVPPPPPRRKRNTRWALSALALVLLVGGGGAAVLARLGGAKAPEPMPVTPPIEAKAPLAPPPPVDTPAEPEPELPALVAAPPQEAETPPEPPPVRPLAKANRKTQPESHPSGTPKAKPLGEAGFAFMTLRSNRPAEIFIDGKSIGRTPAVRHRVKPGRHELRFDCLFDWGRHPGPTKTVDLVAEAEADVLHQCIEMPRADRP